MKKSIKKIKLGLACAGFYLAAALSGPVYSAVKQEVVPQVKLEQVVTVEQADEMYKTRLREYSGDKLLDFGELESLHKIQLTRRDLLEKQKKPLVKEYDETMGAKIKMLDSEIKVCEKKLTSKEKISVLSKTRERLDGEILVHYSALMDKKKGILYSAETLLEPGLNPVFKDIVVEADKILEQYYQDNSLELLLRKKEFNINNVISLYDLIKSKDDYFDKSYEAELKKKLEKLEGEKSRIINLEQNLVFQSNLESLDKKIQKNSKFIRWCELYFNQRKNVKEFEAKYGNFNNECSISAAKRKLLESQGLNKNTKKELGLEITMERFERENESVILGLERCFNNSLEVEDFGNPAKTRLPFWLGTLILGLGFPIVRNLLVKGYVKGSDARGEEYGLSCIAGLGNAALGIILIDGLHPWFYPARMLTPLVIQPIFKILKVDPCKTMSYG